MQTINLGISIKKWINYNPEVGVEGLHMVGLPGTGKSNMAASLMYKCLKNKNELLVMPGDRFCEWRHIYYHPRFPTEMTLLVPQDVEIFYHGFDNNGIQPVKIDYNFLNVFDFLKDSHRMLVIYDQHLSLEERTGLWVTILNQLLNRRQFLERAIGLLFHEAGIYFPEYASGQQWHNVKHFSELFVECRKGLVRPLLVSQLLTEVESTIRKKCMYQVFRKTKLGTNFDRPLRQATPFTSLKRYHVALGGLYVRNNKASKFLEKKLIMKMIPPLLINRGLTPEPTTKKLKTRIIKKQGHRYLQYVDEVGKIISNEKIPEFERHDYIQME